MPGGCFAVLANTGRQETRLARKQEEYNFMKDYMKIYNEWLTNPYFDEATKEELRAIAGDENEI